MSHFNHRIMQRSDPLMPVWLTIHEVYYGEDGRILGWTVDPVPVVGEDLDDIRAGYRLIGTALTKPILEVRGEDLYEDGALVYDHTAPHPWDALEKRVKAWRGILPQTEDGPSSGTP